ncbi:hypothetical protein MY5147_007040 [Beauveria neobassiana]|uniref:Copper acquisition factor BIM1-like domain-containing protein n=1 Tax=Beauveria bassiana D1-5 TaxID=1245745 RepID=A0A0A2VKI3_BEABA|nr:hypothetical protein BBAD15_g6267 [Beauveria bassiana D1-5]
MLSQTALFLAAAAIQPVTAHFGLTQPQWRADTLAAENEAKYSQWTYPCTPPRASLPPLPPIPDVIFFVPLTKEKGAGVPYGAGNTTDWPLDGGPLELELHHKWTYVFVNLGLGGNTTNFNLTLTPELWNTTGKGTFCVEKLAVPSGIAEGTRGTIQIVTSGNSGSALYNCADIRFTKDAKNATCTGNGVTLNKVQESGNATSTSGSSGAAAPSASAGGKSAAGAAATVNGGMLATVVGAAALFALGSSL